MRDYCDVSPSTTFNLNYLQKQWGYLTKHVKIEGKVLDVGCGIGAYMTTLKELGRDVYGADYDDKAIAICRKNGFEVKKWNAKSERLPFKTNFFDSAYAFYIIEHLYDPTNMIQELKRVIKPGGTLAIMTHNFAYDYRNFYGDHTHVHPYNLEALGMLLKQNDFKEYFSLGKYGHAKFFWRFGIFGNYGRAALIAGTNVK